MRKPETIAKLIEKEEQRMLARTKAPRVSAGALNRDVANISHRIDLLKTELVASEAHFGQGYKVKAALRSISNTLKLIEQEALPIPVDVALLCLKPIKGITTGVLVELMSLTNQKGARHD